MRQARWSAFFVPISAWIKGVSGGRDPGVPKYKKFRLSAGPGFGSKLISESQGPCVRLILVNSNCPFRLSGIRDRLDDAKI